MDTGWTEILVRVNQKQLGSASWRSDQASLREIVYAADRMQIHPEWALVSSLCNLRAIIKEAKSAIQNDDVGKLCDLFCLAATLSGADLRLRLGSRRPKEVLVVYRGDNEPRIYSWCFTQQDFNRIQQSTKLFFRFKTVRLDNALENEELVSGNTNSEEQQLSSIEDILS